MYLDERVYVLFELKQENLNAKAQRCKNAKGEFML